MIYMLAARPFLVSTIICTITFHQVRGHTHLGVDHKNTGSFRSHGPELQRYCLLVFELSTSPDPFKLVQRR